MVQHTDTVSNLGVVVDSQLKISAHRTAIRRSCMFHLHQLRTLRHSVSTDAAKSKVGAFISSRRDYCNSLSVGVTNGSITKLLSMQQCNLFSESRKFDYITSILCDLHWSPVRRRLYIQDGDTRLQMPAPFCATIPQRWLCTSFPVVWSSPLAVCRYTQAVRLENVCKLRVCLWTKLVEQPPNGTAKDSEYSCSYQELKTYLFSV